MFQSTSFGQVTFKGKTFHCDIVVDVKGNAYERKSIGDHHYLTPEELKQYLTPDVELVIFGNGQSGVAEVTEKAKKLLKEKGIELIIAQTPEAIKIYNEKAKHKKCLAIIHVTC